MNNDQQDDYNKPVAYDAEGRPLYAHPPAITVDTPPSVSHPVSSPTVPSDASHPASPPAVDAEARHAQSKQRYPHLNLSQGEYVIEEIERHPMGIVPIAGASGFVILMSLLFLMIYPMFEKSAAPGGLPPFNTIILPVVMLIVLATLLGYIAYVIYMGTRLFLTDESLMEEAQASLFARKERTVSLESIEEVTYSQSSVLQTWFNYGTLNIAIEGDHVAYRMTFVGRPRDRVALITNAIEQFKFHRHHGA